MKKIFLGVFVLSLLIGCVAQQGHKDYRALWRSPNATLDQRIEAVTNLVSVGQTRENIQEVLGSSARWTHWHGPTLNVTQGKNGTEVEKLDDHDYWTLDYNFADGSVSLFFEGTNARAMENYRFVRVAPRTSLGNIPRILRGPTNH